MKSCTYILFQVATVGFIERGLAKNERRETLNCKFCYKGTRDNLNMCDKCYELVISTILEDKEYCKTIPKLIVGKMKDEMLLAQSLVKSRIHGNTLDN
jgi:hypothetical protein